MIPTKFYATETSEEQQRFFDSLLIRYEEDGYGDRVVCFNLEPDGNSATTKMYHVLGTTIFVNSFPMDATVTITGKEDSIDEAKSLLEKITEIKLIERVLQGE